MPRRKRRSRSELPVVEQPFNNPFADKRRELKRTIRKAAHARDENGKPRPRGSALPAAGDGEQFLAAVEDAAPLAPKSKRIRARPSVTAGTGGCDTAASEGAVDLTADEHFDIRFSDRYIRARAAGVSRETLDRLERGEFAVRSHVDLHGMALDDARTVVDAFLAECQKRGERCVLVITGKGKNSPHQVGVLREQIPAWLSRGPSARRVLAMATARPCDGGEGALYVLLRRWPARKTRIDVIAGGGV